MQVYLKLGRYETHVEVETRDLTKVARGQHVFMPDRLKRQAVSVGVVATDAPLEDLAKLAIDILSVAAGRVEQFAGNLDCELVVGEMPVSLLFAPSFDVIRGTVEHADYVATYVATRYGETVNEDGDVPITVTVTIKSTVNPSIELEQKPPNVNLNTVNSVIRALDSANAARHAEFMTRRDPAAIAAAHPQDRVRLAAGSVLRWERAYNESPKGGDVIRRVRRLARKLR